jgi:hypothetical protein
MSTIRERPESIAMEKYRWFLVEEYGMIVLVCDQEMCGMIRRPGTFDELLDGSHRPSSIRIAGQMNMCILLSCDPEVEAVCIYHGHVGSDTTTR